MKVSDAGRLSISLDVSDDKGHAIPDALVIVAYLHASSAPPPDSPFIDTPPLLQYLESPRVWSPGRTIDVVIPPLLVTTDWIRGETFSGVLVIVPGFQTVYLSSSRIKYHRPNSQEEMVYTGDAKIRLVPATRPSLELDQLRQALTSERTSWDRLVRPSGELSILPEGEVLVRFRETEKVVVDEFLERNRDELGR